MSRGLKKTNILLPMAGMDDSVDDALLPIKRLNLVKNGVLDKAGRIVKRKGFSTFTNDLSGGGTIPLVKTLFSTGDELCVVSGERLFSYNAARDRWYDRGAVSPCTGRLNSIYRDTNNYRLSDLSLNGSFVCFASSQHHQHSDAPSGNSTYAVVTSIQTVDGHQTIAPSSHDENINFDEAPHAPRTCLTGTKSLVFYQINASGPPNTIRLLEWDSATPTAGFALVGDVKTDAFHRGENTRIYDAISIDSGTGAGDYIFSYIQDGGLPANQIIVERYDSSHALQASSNIPVNAPYSRVAIADSPTISNNFYLIAAADDVERTRHIELWAIRKSDMTAVWGPVIIRPLAADEFCGNLGVVECNGRVVGVYTIGDASSEEFFVEQRSLQAATGTGPNIGLPMYNASLRTRPFCVNGRTYAWMNSAIADSDGGLGGLDDNPGTELFEVQWMADLVVNTVNPVTNTPLPIFCGVHDVGTSVVHDNSNTSSVQIGSANNVINFGAGKHRHMVTTMNFTLRGQTRRHSADEVTVDFNEAPLVATVHRGAALIGGAAWFWYTGVFTEELSFPYPPIPVDDVDFPDEVNPGTGGLPNGVYQYTAVWETYDERGHLHRSVPSPPLEFEVTSGPSDVDLRAKTLSASTRLQVVSKDVNCVWYRADPGGTSKRISQPVRLVPNTPGGPTTSTFRDGGNTQGTTLYTDGGIELDASCPEGGRIPFVAADRVWLGDFFRKDRIQFSKRYVPGTATEDAIAPEFNEAFGFLVRSGRSITGIGELDDKLIVFTESEVFALSGRGPNDGGGANDYSGLQEISNDAGCIEPRSVIGWPGGLLFQSKAGIYNLSRALSLDYIGKPVEDRVASFQTIVASTLVASDNEIRFVCSDGPEENSIILVYNYKWDQWSFWEPLDSDGGPVGLISAALHGDIYYTAAQDGSIWKYESDSPVWLDEGTGYQSLEIETTWLQSNGQSAWQRIWNVVPLLERAGQHDLTIDLFHDFEEGAPFQSVTFTDADMTGFPGLPRLQPKVHVRRQKCQAIRVLIRDGQPAGATSGRGYISKGITFETGAKPGLVKVAPEQRN